jgi:hypothetical protein
MQTPFAGALGTPSKALFKPSLAKEAGHEVPRALLEYHRSQMDDQTLPLQ